MVETACKCSQLLTMVEVKHINPYFPTWKEHFYCVKKLVFEQSIDRICHFVASGRDAIHNIFDG